MTVKKSEIPQVWRLEEAKARFSAVVEQALAGRPQRVTRRGKDSVVVVSVEQWDALTAGGLTAYELIRTAPKFDDFELDIERSREGIRDLDLG